VSFLYGGAYIVKKRRLIYIIPLFFIIITLLLLLVFLIFKINVDKEQKEAATSNMAVMLENYFESSYGSEFLLYFQSDNNSVLDDTLSSLYPSQSLYLKGYLGKSHIEFTIYPEDVQDATGSTSVYIDETGTYVSMLRVHENFGEESIFPKFDDCWIKYCDGVTGEQFMKDWISVLKKDNVKIGVTNDNKAAVQISLLNGDGMSYVRMKKILNNISGDLKASIDIQGESPYRTVTIYGEGNRSFRLELLEMPDVYIGEPPTIIMSPVNFNKNVEHYYPTCTYRVSEN